MNKILESLMLYDKVRDGMNAPGNNQEFDAAFEILDSEEHYQCSSEQEMAEVALALWECLLESPDDYPEIARLRTVVGTAEIRSMFANPVILAACNKGWRAAQDNGFDEPFDWEFCPLFLRDCVGVSDGYLVLRDDWESRCCEIGHAVA